MKISRGRVQQVRKSYEEGKQQPAIGDNKGRPRKPLNEREAHIVGEPYRLYGFWARMLEVVARKVFKTRISHNSIHMYLRLLAWPAKIPRKKGNVNGFDTNESAADRTFYLWKST